MHFLKYVTALYIFLGSYTLVSQRENVEGSARAQEIKQVTDLLDSLRKQYALGNFAESLKYNEKALELALKIKDTQSIFNVYQYFGYNHLVMKENKLAETNFLKSKEYAEKSKELKNIAQSYANLSNLYASAYKDYDKSLEYLDKSIAIFIKSEDTIRLINTYMNASVLAIEAKAYDRAKEFLTFLGDPALKENMSDTPRSSYNLNWAQYYLDTGAYTLAEERAKETIALASEFGFSNDQELAYDILIESFEKQGNYKDGFTASQEATQIKVDNVSKRRDAESIAIETKYKTEQYKLESELSKASVKSKTKFLWLLGVLCLGGLSFGTYAFYNSRKKRILNLQLRKKNKEYLEAKEKSEQLALVKSKFFSTVSHELRTPLYGVIGLSSLLLDDPKLNSRKEDLKTLKFSADYLLALINDVLLINKIDSNNHHKTERLFILTDLMSSILNSFEYVKQQNQNQVELSIDSNTPETLKGNVMQLSQILMNLVGNALKFTENGKVIIGIKTVVKKEGKARISFCVKDNGIGIALEKQEEIFTEFTQVASDDYNYQGTGLGLPIVKKLLNAVGSNITLTSTPGEGSKFQFELDFDLVESDTPVIQEKKVILDLSVLEGMHILVAEDNRINQIVTKKILEEKGMNCTIADNGSHAISLFKDNDDVDLILMDLNMPVLDGFDATKAIRKIDREIPIVALTAVEAEEVRKEIDSVGMNDIVVKPYDSTMFMNVILKNIRKAS